MTLLAEQMSEEEYNELPGLRSTALKYFMKYGPRAYHQRYVLEEFDEQKETTSLRLGKVLHELIIEGKKDWLPWEQGNRSGEHWEAFQHMCEIRGKRALLPSEETDILRMKESIESNPFAMKLLENTARSEQVIQFDYRGMECKLKLDLWLNNDGFVDIKNSIRVDAEGFFYKGINKFEYHKQVAFYEQGIQHYLETDSEIPFWFIVVENKEPFRCAVHTMYDVVRQSGREKVLEGLDKLAECYERDEWPEPLASEVQEYVPGMKWMSDNDVTGGHGDGY